MLQDPTREQEQTIGRVNIGELSRETVFDRKTGTILPLSRHSTQRQPAHEEKQANWIYSSRISMRDWQNILV